MPKQKDKPHAASIAFRLDLYHFIEKHQAEDRGHRTPSRREIGDWIDTKREKNDKKSTSTSTVNYHLNQMVRYGLLEPLEYNSIRLLILIPLPDKDKVFDAYALVGLRLSDEAQEYIVKGSGIPTQRAGKFVDVK